MDTKDLIKNAEEKIAELREEIRNKDIILNSLVEQLEIGDLDERS